MKQFDKWEKIFYKNHRGVYHFTPTCEMGWKAALKWVIKERRFYSRLNFDDKIEKELEE